jgi:hypothetical protein
MVQKHSRAFLTQIIWESVASPNNKRSSTNIKLEITGPLLPTLRPFQLPLSTEWEIIWESLSIHKTNKYSEIGSSRLIPLCGRKYSERVPFHLTLVSTLVNACIMTLIILVGNLIPHWLFAKKRD